MLDIDGIDFGEKVLKASYDQLVVVDFWAPWCGPCLQLLRTFEELENLNQYPITFTKVNVDTHTDIALEQKVMGVPHTKIFASGYPIDEFSDPLPPHELQLFLKSALLIPIILRYSHFRELDIPVAEYVADLEGALGYSKRKDQYALRLAQYYLTKDPQKSLDFLNKIPDESACFEDKLLLKGLYPLMNQDFVPSPLGKKLWAAKNSLRKGNYESAYQFLLQAVRIEDSTEEDQAKMATLGFRQFLGENHELNRKYQTQFDQIR